MTESMSIPSPNNLKLPCVNVGKHDQDGDEPWRAQWIPPELLRILPYQSLKSGLVKQYAEGIIEVACRPPGPNARLISDEGLKMMGIKDCCPELVGLDIHPNVI